MYKELTLKVTTFSARSQLQEIRANLKQKFSGPDLTGPGALVVCLLAGRGVSEALPQKIQNFTKIVSLRRSDHSFILKILIDLYYL